MGVNRKDPRRRLAGIKGKQKSDEPAHDMCVAVAFQIEDGAPFVLTGNLGLEPHLARAAAHLVLVAIGSRVQRIETAAKLDEVAVAVLPLVQIIKILDDLIERRGGPCARPKASRRRLSKTFGETLLNSWALAYQQGKDHWPCLCRMQNAWRPCGRAPPRL